MWSCAGKLCVLTLFVCVVNSAPVDKRQISSPVSAEEAEINPVDAASPVGPSEVTSNQEQLVQTADSQSQTFFRPEEEAQPAEIVHPYSPVMSPDSQGSMLVSESNRADGARALVTPDSQMGQMGETAEMQPSSALSMPMPTENGQTNAGVSGLENQEQAVTQVLVPESAPMNSGVDDNQAPVGLPESLEESQPSLSNQVPQSQVDDGTRSKRQDSYASAGSGTDNGGFGNGGFGNGYSESQAESESFSIRDGPIQATFSESEASSQSGGGGYGGYGGYQDYK